MPEPAASGGAAEELVLVLSTVPGLEAGEELVRRLVEERLIACGNLVPGLTSVYRWQGRVAREAEVLVVMKTVRGRVPELFRRAAALHPYEVPELVVLPVAEVANAYCGWVRQETSEVSA